MLWLQSASITMFFLLFSMANVALASPTYLTSPSGLVVPLSLLPAVSHPHPSSLLYELTPDHQLLSQDGTLVDLSPLFASSPGIVSGFSLEFSPNTTKPVAINTPSQELRSLHQTFPSLFIDNSSSFRQASSSCSTGRRHVLEVAVSFDSLFCDLFSSSEAASAYVQSLVIQASEVFSRDTCLSLALVHLDPNCNRRTDPFRGFSSLGSSPSRSTASRILDFFRSYGEARDPPVRRDIAMLLTGFDEGTSTSGIAFISAACGGSAYGVVERGSLSTFVHEIGHLIGCSHSAEGVMQSSSSGGREIAFSDFSVQQISEYVDSFDSSSSFFRPEKCILPGSAKCDATCPGNCEAGECVRRFSEDAASGLVPCEPIGAGLRCVERRDVGFGRLYPFAGDCPGGFGFVLKEKPGPSTFCCQGGGRKTEAEVVDAENARVNLLVSGGSIPGYVQDEGDIYEATLLDSSLVLSCGNKGSRFPTQRSSPRTRAPPSTTTTQVVPTSTAAGTPGIIPTQGNGRRCVDTFRRGQAFKCSRELALVQRITLDGSVLIVTIRQRAGKFTLQVIVEKNLRIKEVRGLLSLEDTVDEGELKRRTFKDRGVRVSMTSVWANQLKKRSTGSCCGEKVYGHVWVRVCRWNRTECEEIGVLTGSATIQCEFPCARGRRGRILPFGPGRSCPTCGSR